MLMSDYTAGLLNLEDVIITNVENISDQLHIYIELPRAEHGGRIMGRKHKFVNKTHYPDYAIERFTRCIFDDVLAFLQQRKGSENMKPGRKNRQN